MNLLRLNFEDGGSELHLQVQTDTKILCIEIHDDLSIAYELEKIENGLANIISEGILPNNSNTDALNQILNDLKNG